MRINTTILLRCLLFITVIFVGMNLFLLTNLTSTKNDTPQDIKISVPQHKKRSSRRLLPPLEQVVQDEQIIGDVSWLLDFAIVGFAKCGTTTMMEYLNTNETRVFPNEMWELKNYPDTVVEKLYLMPIDKKRGMKHPHHLEDPLFRNNYRKYFNTTNFIVGVRHPVKWFESFYNYRSQEMNTTVQFPHPNDLIDTCWFNVCATGSRFHYFLSMLGRTVMTKEEEALIQPDERHDINPFGAKVFFYEIHQLNDINETRANRFRDDLRQFLGIQNALPPMVAIKPEIRTKERKREAREQRQKNRKAMRQKQQPKHPNKQQPKQKQRQFKQNQKPKQQQMKQDEKRRAKEAKEREKQEIKDARKINICDEEYNQLRDVLMEIAVSASRWIRFYFLDGRDVVVSSRYHLEGVLKEWEHDPCDAE